MISTLIQNKRQFWLADKNLTIFISQRIDKKKDEIINNLVNQILDEATLEIENNPLIYSILLKGIKPKDAVQAHTFDLYIKVKNAVENHVLLKQD